ncbi:hypothetical protein HMPREF9123_2763 [Neisseria bacilliformis ATCC BAA-1200]|uniref:Uncharacterized protein n=1 Tax=Neisseria bacilliformis ATCC BAA-1200 TaxID=888742 RepID=F2BGA6_9NEIS|nr:hypothetical protein HMPREF9123_2763 [Neisseria bacilliformis ATCC BAA-1200]
MFPAARQIRAFSQNPNRVRGRATHSAQTTRGRLKTRKTGFQTAS